MILSDNEIMAARNRGEIVIEPFDIDQLGGNSYDVRLAPVLRVYKTSSTAGSAMSWRGLDIGEELASFGCTSVFSSSLSLGQLDAALEPSVLDIPIPDRGIVLVPGILYLASTVEYTETHRHVPYLDGRSSAGRLGISIHSTAGRGDVGFCNHWTMEITVAQPVRVYHGMKIGQLTYHLVHGDVANTYANKATTTYGKLERNPLPQPSRLWTKLQAEVLTKLEKATAHAQKDDK